MPYVTSIERLARKEGKLEGKLEGQLSMLLVQGEKHLGPPPEEMRAKLKSIGNPDVLESLALRIFEARTWDEWLADLPGIV